MRHGRPEEERGDGSRRELIKQIAKSVGYKIEMLSPCENHLPH
jgi:hypothetical protein